MPQRLRFANSFEGLALNGFDEFYNVECFLPILFYPPGQIVKGSGIKFQVFHG